MMSELRKTVGVLGPKGSYTEQAALEYFKDCEMKDDFITPESVIEAVVNLNVDYGVVPVENSIHGSVGSVFDSLIINRVVIIGELVLPINHVLAKHPEGEEFKQVLSHEQALAQCSNFLRKNHPKCVMKTSASTSRAAQEVMKKGLINSLVVCSEHAAKVYGLDIIQNNISKRNNNKTRFLIIGNNSTNPTGDDKTSIVFGLKDEPGALYNALSVFKKAGINLTKIESRPTKKRIGDYLFIVDFEGHVEDSGVNKALNELKNSVSFMKVLGSYSSAHY